MNHRNLIGKWIFTLSFLTTGFSNAHAEPVSFPDLLSGGVGLNEISLHDKKGNTAQ